MFLKTVFLAIFFYFLALLQCSLIIPYLVLIFVALVNIFDKPSGKLGIFSAITGGFFLDVFSLEVNFFFGENILAAIILSLAIKFLLKKHVHFPSFGKR